MPKIIDHDERRDEFAEAVCRLIVREGAANVTTRQIAAEAGYSTGILAHYFADKSEVMKYALTYSHREVYRFVDMDSLDGLDGLYAFMRACLPLDQRRVFLAQVEASYFGLAVGDSEIGSVVSREFDAFNRFVAKLVRSAVEAGELVPSALDGELVSTLRLVMDGISFRVAVGKRIPASEQLRMLDKAVAEYRVDVSG
ncbi:TetR/AcrR family transcriptional regulator [Brevibacterium sp.]|uniref:TetR/AcrR family transcriptional regulator n=1 Tax=Brevibacterium sp. TaxID=1701 RepID=UPI0025B87104|nr:TetR/AcrR family transcriptional regulator [Brevibacterium sp.]